MIKKKKRYEIFLLESFGDGGVEYEKEIDFQLIKAIAIDAHFIPYARRFTLVTYFSNTKEGISLLQHIWFGSAVSFIN